MLCSCHYRLSVTRIEYFLRTQNGVYLKNANIPNGVFEAVVGCSRVNKVGPAKLLDVSKSLELFCVNDFDEKWV